MALSIVLPFYFFRCLLVSQYLIINFYFYIWVSCILVKSTTTLIIYSNFLKVKTERFDVDIDGFWEGEGFRSCTESPK